ncbi:acyl-CoA dehydrogenase C-terminal domain-containing protein [Ferrimonas balearica]|uniref:acyl-CoA dehydrogenase C-terminal domain-containing protein n=1 Tax=Ferrimonas balearica TaxID=44012 RepID=UPI001C9962EF|nr:acyl-CoA dehydrogenase C-terminal domain-containing protein [Ferrimonas balearica]MBY5921658.1 acyl-CoA dehydrogenase C-terminal domain-containing protein [Ferrimonas balearica]MBY5995002.1 acyl-CoA dehydrogenase C-terminal domain-containing protein [Ferrimonas balearica]
MPSYHAPLKEMQFVLHDLLNLGNHYATLGYDDATPELVDAVLEEAAKFTESVIAPLNRVGDEQGCRFENGEVTTPQGFKEAYQQYVEAGWPTLAQPTEYGGQGLPYSLNLVCAEMQSAANHAFAMYPGLTHGAQATLMAHGDESLQARFMPKLVSGEWTGTMCLTEAHSGSDLGLLRTKAVPQADGSFRLSGSKIFISSGDHDLAENIVHIVIARIEGAPAGTKGISLFLVPKIQVEEDGALGAPNGVSCGSIEHKMGIHGNATCVINFDDATGYLLGEPNRGLSAMFTFMNAARVGVATEGVAAAEAAFQGALEYARERLQMRSLSGAKCPEKAADPIIVHPDVRRMLLTQKAIAEGGRAMVYEMATWVDITKSASADPAAKQRASDRLSLLTPIAKAFLTEMGFEATSLGVQVFGGHGYVAEWGMEQLMRDTKISCLYEGTTGIQALDLLARKVLGSRGALLESYCTELAQWWMTQSLPDALLPLRQSLLAHLQQWGELTQSIALRAQKNPDEIGAASVDYLMFAGYVVLAHQWLRMALVADSFKSHDPDLWQAKQVTAQFVFTRLLPKAASHALLAGQSCDSLMQLDSSQFRS